jgi:hypothetical protein
MIQEVMRVLPQYKAHALIQLKTMLQKESAMALQMRRFGNDSIQSGGKHISFI